MGLNEMKKDVHQRLWDAQQKWFKLKDEGWTKHELKMEGIREKGDMFYGIRDIIFMGSTRVTYEQELRKYVDFAHKVRGKEQNFRINNNDFRAYLNARVAAGDSKKELDKVRAACVKFGALYGRWEEYHATSIKFGEKIRELSRDGLLRGPERPHVTPEVRAAVIGRLRHLDVLSERRTGNPRGYALALELQKEAALRSIEATDRFTAKSLLSLNGDRGQISILGKGGRIRTALISKDLYDRLVAHFARSKMVCLAPRRAYQVSVRRATLTVGGHATGTHAHRRTSAEELKNQRYRDHLKDGKTTRKASEMAVQDVIQHLGHSRNRKDLAKAYLLL
jgi:hypothetical protein